jgi:GNAT superfamily N-acetyltransferase
LIRIRTCTVQDNSGLLNLTTASAMDGSISIRIDRNPDYFALLKLRGEYFVLVAEENGKIIGTISATACESCWSGRSEKAFYLADFKVDPDYRSSFVAVRLVKELHLRLIKENADILFCAIADGNKSVEGFLDGRIGLPPFVQTGKFIINLMPPLFIRRKSHPYEIKRVEINEELLSFYREFRPDYDFAFLISSGSPGNSWHITALKENKICAAISLADTSSVRQNVLICLPGYLRVIYLILRLFRKFFKKIPLPLINQTIRMLYIRSFAVKNGEDKALRALIQSARYYLSEEGYSLLAWGLQESDHHNDILKGVLKLKFISLPFFTSLADSNTKIEAIVKGRLFLDYSII